MSHPMPWGKWYERFLKDIKRDEELMEEQEEATARILYLRAYSPEYAAQQFETEFWRIYGTDENEYKPG